MRRNSDIESNVESKNTRQKSNTSKDYAQNEYGQIQISADLLIYFILFRMLFQMFDISNPFDRLETIQLKQEEIFKSCKELIKVYRDQRIRDILSSVQQMTKQKGRKISMQQISRWECIVKLTKALSGLLDRANKISQVQSVSSIPNRTPTTALQIRNMSKSDSTAKQTNDSYLPIIAEIIETPMVEIEKSMEGFPRQLSRLFTKVAARLEEFYDLLIGTLLLEHKRANERFLIQLEAEYHREDLKCLLLFVLVTACSRKRRITDDQKSAIHEIKEAICKTDALDKGKLTAIHNKISKLETSLQTGLGITEEERKMIVSAMPKGWTGGHWFSCPNGHPYVIGECGGAAQQTHCPFDGCGELIGGINHRLVSTNRHLPEMDRTLEPAWPQPQLHP